ncbi:MAG: acyltransferase family protein [Bacilli bacterium]|nr:acyltransferase family protein [Bacilli bacterium]
MVIRNKRIEWIDICKTIGIFFVTIGHVAIPKIVDIWIHSFHMPLFFILSGLCFNEVKHKKSKEFILNRLKTLIVPYIIFSWILYYLWILINFLYNKTGISTSCNILINCMLNPATNTSCYGAVNWFLPSLFIIEIFFFFISKICKHNRKVIFLISIIISIIGFFTPTFLKTRLPLAIDSSIIGLSFYSIGWLLKGIKFDKIKIVLKRNILLSHLVIIGLFIFFIPIIMINKMTNIRTLVFGNYSLFFLNSICMSILFILVSILLDIDSKKVKIINKLKIIGKHTLIILLFNPVLGRIYLLLTEKVVISNKYLLLLNSSIVSVIILIICTLISIFINKFLPFLIGKKKKV